MRRSVLTRWVLCLLATLALVATAVADGGTPRRPLKVVVYPFIPDRYRLYYEMKRGFEAEHPDVDVQPIDLFANYYDPKSEAAITNTDADVYELDAIFLPDLATSGRIQPLPSAAIPDESAFLPVSVQSSKWDGKWYGVPHWVCSNFVFTRIGDPISGARTFSDLERLVGPEHEPGSGILMDAKGTTTLGELYINALIDNYGSLEAAEKYLDPQNLDPTSVDIIQRLTRLFDRGYGRDKAYHNALAFYPSQFARKKGRVLVGYAEAMNSVLWQASNALEKGERIWPGEIDVTEFPLTDKEAHPFAWVDTFAIDKRCDQQKLADAAAFVKYVSQPSQVRASLLDPDDGSGPRYVLPALATLYNDKVLLASCPLYAKEQKTVARAVPVTSRNLVPRLRAVAAELEKQLARQ